jgi:hypothetical protein
MILAVLSGLVGGCSFGGKVIGGSTEPIQLSSVARIADDRSAARYGFTNGSALDVVCDTLTVRAIADDPNTYLEKGEQVVQQHYAYLKVGETVGGIVRSQSFGGPASHIRAVSTLEGEHTCRQASFDDYCQFAKRTAAEEAFLSTLLSQHKAKTCIELARRLERKQRIDVSGIASWTARPLIFLTGLKTLTVAEGNNAVRKQFERLSQAEEVQLAVGTP